jgi:two-component system sensor histidine kinase HydH
MTDEIRGTPRWLDLLWLLFLAGLALLPPVREMHKLLILGIIGAFQLVEGRILQASPRQGPYYVVLVKIGLATILMNHTHEVAINSSYYPIFYLPIMTAAMYFGPLGTLLWTLASAAAYCSYLPAALGEFEMTSASTAELSMRILFFFLVGMIVNRFVMDYRNQVRRYQALAETLSEANRNLKQAQAEAQRAERLAALGQLSAGLAHEIRNPLGVIKGSAEILNQKLAASDELAKELSGYIYTEVNRLSALVSRFLDFARPLHVEPIPQDVRTVIEKSLKAVADQRADVNVRITQDYAPHLQLVMADPELCDQAFTNLLLNACQAMGEQGGELHIRVRPEYEDKKMGVAIEIHDTGPGIAPEMKEEIFNPFVTTKKTGVGLGLAIVSRILDGHGGSVRVMSASETPGACFRVWLPSAPQPAH